MTFSVTVFFIFMRTSLDRFTLRRSLHGGARGRVVVRQVLSS